MKKEDLVAELISLLDFIDAARNEINLEYDKFQVALSSTLRLLDEGSPTISKMKGKTDDLKAYVIRTSSQMRQTSIDPFRQLSTKIERLRDLVEAS
jgi:hypothetical protein